MRHLAVLFIHFIATLARLFGPDGVRSIVEESLPLLRNSCSLGGWSLDDLESQLGSFPLEPVSGELLFRP
jgi:hypothetical protein